jgi:hypothetical protein
MIREDNGTPHDGLLKRNWQRLQALPKNGRRQFA